MFKKLIDKFKNQIFHTEEYIRSEEDLEKEKIFLEDVLSNAKFGDIVWALRYDFEWDGKEIDDNHKIGPYIVIDKTDDKLICMYCTSVEGKRNFFEIGEDYELFFNDKKTYTCPFFLRTIDYISYVNTNLISLNEKDKKAIQKKLAVQKYITYNDLGIDKTLSFEKKDISLDVGDVIKDHQAYKLIIEKNGDALHTLQLQTYNPYLYKIDFPKEKLDFGGTYELMDINKYVGTLSTNSINAILAKFKEHQAKIKELQELKENFTIKRGSLLFKNNKNYYVYNIERDNAQAFTLKPSIKNPDCVKIGPSYYKPNYEETIDINIKDDSYKLVRLAKESEMELISEDRKRFIKTKKEKLINHKKEILKANKKKPNNFVKGNVIKSEHIFAMEFIVLGIIDNTIITVSLDAFLSNKITFFEFSASDKSLSLVDNVDQKTTDFIKLSDYYLDCIFEDVCSKKEERKLRRCNHGNRLQNQM